VDVEVNANPARQGRPSFFIFFSSMFSDPGLQPVANELHKATMTRIVMELVGAIALLLV
jgi:hypothetical protein